MNTTLDTILLLPGHWRLASSSMVVTSCEGSNAMIRCIGGSSASSENLSAAMGDGYCAPEYTGPECKLCRGGQGLYLDGGECKACPEFGPRLALFLGLVAVASAVLAFLMVAVAYPGGGRVPVLRLLRRFTWLLVTYGKSIGLLGKAKLLFSATSIAMVLNTTYDAKMPDACAPCGSRPALLPLRSHLV
jgi:hypothetical protein